LIPFDGLSRRPKNRGPFQRVPVIARATLERLGPLTDIDAHSQEAHEIRSIPRKREFAGRDNSPETAPENPIDADRAAALHQRLRSAGLTGKGFSRPPKLDENSTAAALGVR
jgi:hypothetical protein